MNFIRTTKIFLIILIVTLLLVSCSNVETNTQTKIFQPVELFPEPARPAGQKDVLELRNDPIDTVRIGFIGLGNRGEFAVRRYTKIKGVEIKAICDLEQFRVDVAKKVIAEAGLPAADAYTGQDDWKKICERDDIDLIYIVTDWGHHTEMAVYAMEHGKHAVTEVPAATTIDECWQLVNTSEKTRKHFMQLENCVYDDFEMAEHRMAEEGVFGEIVHVEGAYIHDIRGHVFKTDLHDFGYWNMWRLEQNATRNGNLYPTHGLGPLCHLLNIHRGDRMEYVVSLSSDQYGLKKFARDKFGKDSDFAKRTYLSGDMNTSLIRTKNGKTILIQHDVSNPTPYSRIQKVVGTKAYACMYPIPTVVLDTLNGDYYPDPLETLIPMRGEKLKRFLKKYEHPIIKEISDVAKKVGGHGGMDYVMDYRLIYCLHNGLPLDQDVYDAAEWSALGELSEISNKNHGLPIKYPDFTRGAWKKLKKVKYYHK